jgi:hypothetical protein
MRDIRSFISRVALSAALALPGCSSLGLLEPIIFGDGEPDLILAVPAASSAVPGVFCGEGPSAVVAVENRGDGDADSSVTTIVFNPGGAVEVQTSGIDADQTVDLRPIAVPPECFNPDCVFSIRADSGSDVDESDEGNNTAEGICPASVAP